MSRAQFIAKLTARAELDREIKSQHIETVARFKIDGWEEDAIIVASPPLEKWSIPDTEPSFYFCAPALFELIDGLMLKIEKDGFYTFNGTEKISFEDSKQIHKLCAAEIRGLMG